MSSATGNVPPQGGDDAGQQGDGIYNYVPTEWICIVFVALFSVSTLLHIGQSVRYRLWFLLATAVCCGLGEILGWSARLWSSQNVRLRTPFLMQISTTIIAPTFLVAANFIILGRVIRLLGPQYSRLAPRWYAYIFLSADTAALVVQAVGGGQASAAETLEGANQGARVMLGGILLQFVAIIFYTLLATEFLIRYALDKPVRNKGFHEPRAAHMDTRLRLMVVGLGISTLFLLIRTIYRTIELQDGWNGDIIANQLLFNALDGMPIVVAMFTLNFFHPGMLVYNAGRVEPATSTTEGNGVEKIPKTPGDQSPNV